MTWFENKDDYITLLGQKQLNIQQPLIQRNLLCSLEYTHRSSIGQDTEYVRNYFRVVVSLSLNLEVP